MGGWTGFVRTYGSARSRGSKGNVSKNCMDFKAGKSNTPSEIIMASHPYPATHGKLWVCSNLRRCPIERSKGSASMSRRVHGAPKKILSGACSASSRAEPLCSVAVVLRRSVAPRGGKVYTRRAAMGNGLKEAIFLLRYLWGLSIFLSKKASAVYTANEDNVGPLYLASNPVTTTLNSKRIDMRNHFVRERVACRRSDRAGKGRL